MFVSATANAANIKRVIKVTKINEENALKSCSFSLHLQQLLSYDMDAYIEVVLHSFVKPTCIKEYFYESIIYKLSELLAQFLVSVTNQ